MSPGTTLFELSAGVALDAVMKSSRRLPFGTRDAEAITLFLRGARKNALDLTIQHGTDEDIPEMMREGIVLLESYDLRAQFAFLNVDAGRGFFGGQKSQVLTYSADLFAKKYIAGPVLPNLLRALVGVNNIYRAEGLLRGSGI